MRPYKFNVGRPNRQIGRQKGRGRGREFLSPWLIFLARGVFVPALPARHRNMSILSSINLYVIFLLLVILFLILKFLY